MKKRFPRAKADELVKRVLEAIPKINCTPGMLYHITKVAVFGSYCIPTIDILGDLDLLVEVTAVPALEKLRHRPDNTFTEACIRRTATRRPGIRNYIDAMFWPRLEPILMLRRLSPRISTEPWADTEFARKVHKQVIWEAHAANKRD